MIVVTDTSPLRYLVMLGNEWLLPRLYQRVVCPDAGLIAVGTIGILAEAARNGWINYDATAARLISETNFRVLPGVVELGRMHSREE